MHPIRPLSDELSADDTAIKYSLSLFSASEGFDGQSFKIGAFDTLLNVPIGPLILTDGVPIKNFTNGKLAPNKSSFG